MIPSSQDRPSPFQRWLTVTRMPETSFPADADVAGIGPRMLRLRVQQGLTQTELAGDRFTRAYVSSIEGGKRTPSPSAATYFATRLGTDLEDLCFGYPPGRRRALLAEAAEARVVLSGGETEQATAVYEALCAEAEQHQDRTLRALGRYGLGLVARHGGDPGAGGALFEEAEALLHDRPLAERLPTLMGRVWALFAGGSIDDALTLVEDHLREAVRTSQATAEFALLAACGLTHVERGNLGRAGALADAALKRAPDVSASDVLAQGYYHINRVLVAQGRYDEAEQTIVRATALYQDLRLRTEVGMCRFAHGFLTARRGRLVEAEAQLREARDILSATGAVQRRINATAELAEVVRKSGRAAEAAGLVGECRDVASGRQDPEQAAELDRIEARIAADRGDAAAAETLFRSAIERYLLVGATLEAIGTCRLLGDQLLRTGRTEEAAEVYRRGLAALEGV
jgi:tetratricopeptide (TPR) repeat protein